MIGSKPGRSENFTKRVVQSQNQKSPCRQRSVRALIHPLQRSTKQCEPYTRTSKQENGTTFCRILTLFGLSSEKRVATRFHTLNILRESFRKRQRPVLVSIVAEKQIVMFSTKQKERGQITEKRGASKSMEKYEMSSRILRSASKSMQKHPRCFEDSMRSDQMFANVCSYAQCESVRQTVLAASIQNRKKDDSRETPEIASMRRSVLAELFTHSWRCISTSCVVQDILRRPALVSVTSESRLTFSSQLRQSLKIPNRGHSTTTLGRSAVCYAGRAGAEGRM